MPVKYSRSRTLIFAAAAALVLLPGCSDGSVQAGDAGADRGTLDAVNGRDGDRPDGKAPDGNPPADGKLHDGAPVKDLSSKDLVGMDLPAKDLPISLDGTTAFPQVLDGVWLFGWFGGLNRFSWVRFKVTSASSGSAQIYDGSGLSGGTIPYWNCNGSTTWNITAKPMTFQLHYPSGACNGNKSDAFTLSKLSTFSGTYPKGALLEADLQVSSGVSTIKGYKFPPSQCNAAMTSCTDPLK